MADNYAIPPTISNTINYFVTTIIEDLFKEDNNNLVLLFDFKEEKAREYIKALFRASTTDEERIKIFENKIDNPYSKTAETIVVKNYKEFFELLSKVYELDVNKYIEHEQSSYRAYRMANLFRDLWVRTSEMDYVDINRFLSREIEMYQNDIFSEYNDEYYLGDYNSDEDIALTCHNKISATWDECPYQMIFGLQSKRSKDDWSTAYFTSFPDYELPKVRYGIYEENGKLICRIGSIQKDILNDVEDSRVTKIAKRMRYKLYNDEGIEPNKMISLFLFICLLKSKGINKIEIPPMYPLDYDYHLMRSKFLANDLYENWTPYRIECEPSRFEETKRYFLENFEQEDKISKIKTEDLINTALKTTSYIETSEVLDYDNRILIDIGNFNMGTIRNQFLGDLYSQVGSRTGKNYVKRMTKRDYYSKESELLEKLLFNN